MYGNTVTGWKKVWRFRGALAQYILPAFSKVNRHLAGSLARYAKHEAVSWKQKGNTKRTAAGIPTWSPTVVLICRSTAYVWQSGRDAQFSADC
ncbi:hypothetical protein KCU71_g15379, partial [Aureobasidium melanogenum]